MNSVIISLLISPDERSFCYPITPASPEIDPLFIDKVWSYETCSISRRAPVYYWFVFGSAALLRKVIMTC